MPENLKELLAHLKKLSPMPSDEEVTDEQLEEYEAVIDALEDRLGRKKDVSVIRPLVDSFGYGDGNGLYWSALHILEEYDTDDLFPHLRDAVRSGNPGSRMWAALMFGRAQDSRAVPDLLKLLEDPDEYVRANAVLALSMIGDLSAREAIEQLQDDPSEEVREAVRSSLADFSDEDEEEEEEHA